ncbi:phosphoglycerate kinase [Candidatus Nomurabacteria bacterium RIFCSPHIGHO2_02_FULL_33_12]|nr:MAG: phosphoglycerate kinase [Candidatus Nomurabacteria bacterium RIFCSPHIGHO2_02_FULL_33_12]
MKSLNKLAGIKNKTVILRADFNVPIIDDKIIDSFRIDATLPTIDYLLKKGANIIILAHLGDDGKKSLAPIARYLNKKKYKGYFEKSDNPEIIRDSANRLCNGEILLVENIRRFAGEKENKKDFAVFLASLGIAFVNDAFAVSHRNHASVIGIPKLLPSYAGIQMEKEIKMLGKILKPKHPFLFILGGAKFETKLPLLKKYLNIADAVFVGGALANTLLKERGYEIGKSLNEDDIKGLKQLVKNPKLLLPMDVVVERGKTSLKKLNTVGIEEVEKKDTIIDVGTETLTRLIPLINSAKLIVFNGPIGKIEDGTKDLLKLLAKSKAEVIIGGGDTDEVINELKMRDKFTFVSTGGGATLEFLAHGTLPGIKALKLALGKA